MNVVRRLGLAGLGLLLLATVLVVSSSMQQLQSLAKSESQARARLIADGLAQRIERAATLGIPLASLRGVDSLFEERMAEFKDIASLSLVDASGQVLAQRARTGAATSERMSVPIRNGGRDIAQLVLEHRPASRADLAARWGPLLAAVAVLFAFLAVESARYAFSRGPARRDAVVAASCEALRAGDFTHRLPMLPRRESDLRPQWLSAQLRQVHERHLRISRLATSLRKTEPDASRRAALDETVRKAQGEDRFAEGTPPALASPDAGSSDSRALGLVTGVAAWLPALAAMAWMRGPAMTTPSAQITTVLVSWLAVALVASAALRRRPLAWRSFAWGAIATLAFAGPGLFIAATVLLEPQATWPFTAWGEAACAWVILGCLAAPLLPLRRAARAQGVAADESNVAELQGAA